MNSLLIRSLTGLAFGIIVIFGTLFSPITFFFLYLAILIIVMIEFYRLNMFNKVRPNFPLGLLTGIYLFILFFIYSIELAPIEIFYTLIPLTILIFVNELYRFKKFPFFNISVTLTGILYVALPISLLNIIIFKTIPSSTFELNSSINFINSFVEYFLYFQPNNENIVFSPLLVVSLLIVIWVFDTFAYIIGVLLGRNRLFISISPKKSWEGLIGGLIASISSGFILESTIGIMNLAQWLIFGLVIGIAPTFGYLIESTLKRSVKAKDSGVLLPGHGGMLDRFDSLLIASPIAILYFELCI